MIMRFLKKIPAGMMVVPMLLGAIINMPAKTTSQPIFSEIIQRP